MIAASGPSPLGTTVRPASMSPTWLTVDHASRRLRSGWAKASRDAPTVVTATSTASRVFAAGAACSSGKSWARTTVPAATIVAAWMSADAGVGPSMASGSQSWNGSCADLPATPRTTRTMATVSGSATSARRATTRPSTETTSQRWTIALIDVVPAWTASATRPRTIPTSARRVTRSALVAARFADSLTDRCPMSRNEHQPITSQPTSVRSTSSEWTTSIIAAVKRETVAANDRYRGSYQRYQRANTWMTRATTPTTT